MGTLLRMDTAVVRDFSSRLNTGLDEMEQSVQSARGGITSASWNSPARDQLVVDFQQVAAHLLALVDQGREMSRRVSTEAGQWEEMANLSSPAVVAAGGGGGGVNLSSASTDPSSDDMDRLIDSYKYPENLHKFEGYLLKPALMALTLYPTKTGLYGIHASKFVKKWMLGWDAGRTVITHANVVKEVTEISRLDKVMAVLSFGQDLYSHRNDLDAAMVTSVLAVNAVEFGAEYAAGAFVGQILCPVPGVGAAIGVVAAKALVSYGFEVKVLPGGKSIEDVSIDWAHDTIHQISDRLSD